MKVLSCVWHKPTPISKNNQSQINKDFLCIWIIKGDNLFKKNSVLFKHTWEEIIEISPKCIQVKLKMCVYICVEIFKNYKIT